MANSSDKGKRGERELCKVLRKRGFGAIRSAQVTGFKDHSDSADIITSLDPLIRFEVKRGYNDTETHHTLFFSWIQKMVKETPEGKFPILAWRKDYQNWQFFRAYQDHSDSPHYIGDVDDFITWIKMGSEAPVSEFQVEDPSTWKTTDTFS